MTAGEYIKNWEKSQGWQIYETAERHKIRLKNCALACRGKTFADVGCAFGHSTRIMREWRPGDWVGIDFYPEVVKRVDDYNSDILAYYSPTYEMKKNIGGTFDSVVCSEVIERIPPVSLQFFFNQLIDLAKRKIIITTPARVTVSGGNYKTYFKENEIELLISGNPNIKKYKIEQGGPFWYVYLMR